MCEGKTREEIEKGEREIRGVTAKYKPPDRPDSLRFGQGSEESRNSLESTIFTQLPNFNEST